MLVCIRGLGVDRTIRTPPVPGLGNGPELVQRRGAGFLCKYDCTVDTLESLKPPNIRAE